MKQVRLEDRAKPFSGTDDGNTFHTSAIGDDAGVRLEVTNDFRRWVFLEARESYGDAFTPQT